MTKCSELWILNPTSWYAKTGRPSIPPERLLRALLLQIFYSIRSERMLMEQLEYNLLFRWFAGMEMDEPVWNHAVFSKNRELLKPISVGADKAYETRDFVGTRRSYGMRPHLAQNLKRTGGSAIDPRSARHDRYHISQRSVR